MIGERGAGQTGGLGKLTDRHAFLACLHQQTIEIQAMLLSQGVKTCKRIN